MSEETFNGWSNYATWAVANRLQNDEASYRFLEGRISDNYNNGAWEVAEALRKHYIDVREIACYTEDGEPKIPPLFIDLLAWALDSVNYREVIKDTNYGLFE